MVDASEEVGIDWDVIGGGRGRSSRWGDLLLVLLLLPRIGDDARSCFVEEGDEVGSRRGDGSTSVLGRVSKMMGDSLGLGREDLGRDGRRWVVVVVVRSGSGAASDRRKMVMELGSVRGKRSCLGRERRSVSLPSSSDGRVRVHGRRGTRWSLPLLLLLLSRSVSH